MKVIEAQRVDFTTGENVPPEDINVCFLYARDALDDVQQRRFTRSVVVLPYCVDVGTAYDQTMTGTEELTYRFTCPVTCFIDRARISANMTSSAEVQWTITTAAGATPSGATAPWLSTKGAFVTAAADSSVSESSDGIIASASDQVDDVSHDKILLVAGTEYKLSVSCSGNFSLQRADLVLELLTDRWTTAGTTALPTDTLGTPTMFHDGDLADVGLNTADNQTNLNTAAALLASSLNAPAPLFFVKHGILSGTDADLRTFGIPVADTARARVSVTKIYVYAMVAGACTIKGILRNASGSTVAEVDVVCSGAGFFSSGTLAAGALPAALSSATAGAPANTALDYAFVFVNSSGANDGTKVYALLWVSRG